MSVKWQITEPEQNFTLIYNIEPVKTGSCIVYCRFSNILSIARKWWGAERHVLWIIQNSCLIIIIQQPQGQAEKKELFSDGWQRWALLMYLCQLFASDWLKGLCWWWDRDGLWCYGRQTSVCCCCGPDVNQEKRHLFFAMGM